MDNDLLGALSSASQELQSMLNCKTVVGEPIQLGSSVVVPLISVGFGMAAGYAKGRDRKGGEGGTGLGAGGGARPIAVLISDESGVRLESIQGSTASAMGSIAETIASVIREKNRDESE